MGTPENIINDVYALVDPKHNTPFKKSSDSFMSICPTTGQITLSRKLARDMGFMSGDRMGFTEHQKNPYVWLIFKTTQSFRTIEVKIRAGSYTANSKEITAKIGVPFCFNMEFKSKIRMYVNTSLTINSKTPDGRGGFDNSHQFQIYDIPFMRNDFLSEELKKEYVEKMSVSDYIITGIKR